MVTRIDGFLPDLRGVPAGLHDLALEALEARDALDFIRRIDDVS